MVVGGGGGRRTGGSTSIAVVGGVSSAFAPVSPALSLVVGVIGGIDGRISAPASFSGTVTKAAAAALLNVIVIQLWRASYGEYYWTNE